MEAGLSIRLVPLKKGVAYQRVGERDSYCNELPHVAFHRLRHHLGGMVRRHSDGLLADGTGSAYA